MRLCLLLWSHAASVVFKKMDVTYIVCPDGFWKSIFQKIAVNQITDNQSTLSEPRLLWTFVGLRSALPALCLRANSEFHEWFCWKSELWIHNGIAVFRQGLKSSQNERGASAVLTIKMDNSMGGVATQVRFLLWKISTVFTPSFLYG